MGRRATSTRSLAGQFLVFQLVVIAIVLAAVAAVSVTQSTDEFRDVRGQRMIAVAENLASTPIVRDRFADPFAAQILAPDVDRAVALSGAGVAEIADPAGVVRVSSDPSRIGRTLDMTDSGAPRGRAPSALRRQPQGQGAPVASSTRTADRRTRFPIRPA